MTPHDNKDSIMNSIRELTPQDVWNYFADLCEIPHVSGNEAGITAYLQEFAQKHNLKCKTSPCGNVLIVRPASADLQHKPAVILQAHTDMVGVKLETSQHDFATDPIQTTITPDGTVTAVGTTLGADDGIGVALILCLLADPNLHAPELHGLFTVSEETDMVGANALTPDFVQANLGINIDSEDLGEICIGCAGGTSFDIVQNSEISSIPNDYSILQVKIHHATGGHSGIDADKGRINAACVLLSLTEILWENSIEAYICNIKAGYVRNSIPAEGEMMLAVQTAFTDKALSIIEENCERITSKYVKTDPKILFSTDILTEAANKPSVMLLSTPDIINFRKLNTRVIEHDDNQNPLTSCNLGYLEYSEGHVTAKLLARYSTPSGKTLIEQTIAQIVTQCKAEIAESSSYPFWEPNYQSHMLKTAASEFKNLTGHDAKTTVIHAGLECGIIQQQNSKLDVISSGPDVFGAHSPKECVNIKSVEICHIWLKNILASI